MEKQLSISSVEALYDEYGTQYGLDRLTKGVLVNDYIERPALRELIQSAQHRKKNKISSVLDIGCGPGVYAKDLAGQGKSVTALDISNEMLNFAKEHCKTHLGETNFNNINFIHSSFEAFNGEKNKFDLILATFMLSYFPDLDFFFRKVNRLLEKRGKIITSMLHPIRLFSDVSGGSNGYLVKDYFQNGHYDSDFMDKNNHIPLKRWRIEEVVNAAFNNGLLIEKILEPTPVINLPEEFKEKADFFKSNPSLIMFMLRKK